MNMNPVPEAPSGPPPQQAQCRNCGVALHGPHCHACGQPVKGLMRPLGSVFGDLLDSVFDFDARIPRTLRPLFLQPGYLTEEYFAGRQIRYVTPFRLFFFLTVLAFFVARLTVNVDTNVTFDSGAQSMARATTVPEVVRLRDAQLAEMAKAKQEMAGTPAAAGIPGIEAGEASIRKAADRRIRELQGLPPADPTDAGAGGVDTSGLIIDGKPWDASKHPVAIGWLPGFANAWLNAQIQAGVDNVARLKQNPALFKNAALSAIPTTLFVLVPVFALMLKLAYLFRRRLYMEHLVVALHSHAFLSLSLLLVLLAHLPSQTFAPEGSGINTLFDWVQGLLLLWMPVYLLLMQKRVYAQGWPMTLLTYGVLGVCYTVLLAFAITAAALIGLVSM